MKLPTKKTEILIRIKMIYFLIHEISRSHIKNRTFKEDSRSKYCYFFCFTKEQFKDWSEFLSCRADNGIFYIQQVDVDSMSVFIYLFQDVVVVCLDKSKEILKAIKISNSKPFTGCIDKIKIFVGYSEK